MVDKVRFPEGVLPSQKSKLGDLPNPNPSLGLSNVSTVGDRESFAVTVGQIRVVASGSKVALTARTMKVLRCVYCHDNVRMGALNVSNCPGCQTCFHDECRELLCGKAQCPTLGCKAILRNPRKLRRRLLPRRSFDWELEFLNEGWTLKGALISGLNIVVATFVTVALTSALLALGMWFIGFKFPPMKLLGFLAVLGSFLQAPALFILCSQWLSQRSGRSVFNERSGEASHGN